MKQAEHVLLVESAPFVCDLIAKQTLKAAGYSVEVVEDAAAALARVAQHRFSLVIVNLNLPGFSGKDFLVALSARGYDLPVIALAKKGMDTDIIQAFRLGAADFLIHPLREAEILTAVERVLKQVRERRERERLAAELKQTNQELKARIEEQNILFSIGKAVTSITDQALLFERILEGALKVTKSDLGWFLVRSDTDQPFILVAHRNLPPSLAERLGKTWDDEISSLVALSAQTLAIEGDSLHRFKVSALGQAALISPVKAQRQVIGLICLMRCALLPFNKNEQSLIEAVADYASISLVNARLFKALEEKLHQFQKQAASAVKVIPGGAAPGDSKGLLSPPLDVARRVLNQIVNDPAAHWTAGQRQSFAELGVQLQRLSQLLETLAQAEKQVSP